MLHKYYKTKQFPLLFLKIGIVGLAFSFILWKLFYNGQDSLKFLGSSILEQHIPIIAWLFLLILSCGNWFFEIKKWQLLAGQIRKTNISEAINETFSAFTASVFTPNRIGEYGAKSLFYPKKDWKKVVFMNFFGNISQLLVTFTFGLMGLLFLFKKIQISFSETKILVFIGVLLLTTRFLLFQKQKNGYLSQKMRKLRNFVQKIPSALAQRVILHSFLRYLLFSHQFYLFLMLFDAEIGYFDAISCIFVVYLFASALPSIFFMEAVVKGSVAIWIFSFFKIPEIAVLSSVGLMWLFNFALPAVVGSFYVMKFRPLKLKTT